MTGSVTGRTTGLDPGFVAGWAQALAAELPAAVRLRRELHAAPELSGSERRTAHRVAMAIGAPAGAVEEIATTGRLIRIGPAGPSIAVRAELDGLPIQELSGASFAATNGAMHACGHDVHLAAMVAVLRAACVAGTRRLPAGLVALLQPREEVSNSGAADIVASGRLPGHQVRALVAAHIQPQVAAGRVAIDAGPVNAGVGEFRIIVTGRGGHSAYPHLAVDPVPPLLRIVLALPDAVRAVVNPMHPATLTVPQLFAANASNVIPDQASAVGTLRTMWEDDAVRVRGRIEELVRGIAVGHGCTAEVQFAVPARTLVNDPVLAARARTRFAELGGELADRFASCGSDDFANYAGIGPTLMMFVGTGAADGASSLHDPRFLPSDARVGEVARALLAGCLAALERIS